MIGRNTLNESYILLQNRVTVNAIWALVDCLGSLGHSL
jgi:hypothetical protein